MIFPYPGNVRIWLRAKGRCEHCNQTFDAPPCKSSDHYCTCLDLAYEQLHEEATEAELNEPQPEFEEII